MFGINIEFRRNDDALEPEALVETAQTYLNQVAAGRVPAQADLLAHARLIVALGEHLTEDDEPIGEPTKDVAPPPHSCPRPIR